MTPPQYTTLLHLNNNISNVCVLCVISTELGSQIHRSSHRDRLNPIPKTLQGTIYVISSNLAFTRIQACEQLRKFSELEHASTSLLNFASKSSKGQILRALDNFKGPFDTPIFPCKSLHCKLYSISMTRIRIFDNYHVKLRGITPDTYCIIGLKSGDIPQD